MKVNNDAYKLFCRFYKEETECPFLEANKQMFWHCEKWWLEQIGLKNEAGCNRVAPLMDEYRNAGLNNYEMYDGVPITLKAVLFNRYCKYMDGIDIEGFKELYTLEYREE